MGTYWYRTHPENEVRKYEGPFVDGLKHGKGKLIDRKKDYQFEGFWVEGKPEGAGIMTDTSTMKSVIG